MALDPDQISFRLLTRDDFPLLQRWLNTPHVLEWWDKPGPTLAEVERKYLPRAEGRDPTESFVIEYAARPIGYIQRYLIEDYPDYAQHVGLDERAAGIDVFIGEVDLIHRGLGPELLKRFLRDHIFDRPDIDSCVIGPAISNTIAIRAYEKAGFVYFKTADIPDEDEPEYLMRVGRRPSPPAPLPILGEGRRRAAEAAFLPVCPRTGNRDHSHVRPKSPLSQNWEMVLPPVGRELVGGNGRG